MSRLGKQPIKLPAGTTAKRDGNRLAITGPKGNLALKLHEQIDLKLDDKEITVMVKNPGEKKQRAFWGLYRSLINNMVAGVNEGFEKKLEIQGVGYRASVQGKNLTLNVGYSHPVIFELPEGIGAQVEGSVITVNGIDKQLVGEIAARIRKIRKPEPYKGKGIKYSGETIRRKAGKTAAKSTQ